VSLISSEDCTRKDEHFEKLDIVMVMPLKNCGHIVHWFGYLKF